MICKRFIGALIGDIAAWTYENDRSTFFRQLIPDRGRGAMLSLYGHALMRAASRNVLDVREQDVSFIRRTSGKPQEEQLANSRQWLMWQLMCAWDDGKTEPAGLDNDFPIEKEEGYSRMFVINLIRSLRSGKTKSDVYHSEYLFEKLSREWNWGPWKKAEGPGGEYSILTHVFRAWDSFYRGFDFTSSIHNAVRWDGDRCLIAALTGAFADAMYGSEQSFIKKKYAGNGQISHFNDIRPLGEAFGYHHALVMEMADISFSRRSFFPKNCAQTNVERHVWKDCHSRLESFVFTERDRNQILIAGRTGWDNRYGVYLDDGWLYCYRSYTLLLRFKLQAGDDDGTWGIANIQLSGEHPSEDSLSGLENALSETCRVILQRRGL